MIANYHSDPLLTYKTLSTFRIVPSNISCISKLINSKISTLLAKIKQVILHQGLGKLCPTFNLMESQIKAKLVAARKSFQFLKRTIHQNVSLASKILYYRLYVHSILLYGSHIWDPSISPNRHQKNFNRKRLCRVAGTRDLNFQLSRTHSSPTSYYLILHDSNFLN